MAEISKGQNAILRLLNLHTEILYPLFLSLSLSLLDVFTH